LAKKAASGTASARAAEEKIEGFAEDLGRLLGTAQAKATSWLDQRKVIADQLTKIRDTASDYLRRLSGTESGGAVEGRKRRGRPPGSGKKTGRKGRPPGSGKRKGGMSAEGRARVAAAQRARWAKIHAQQGKRKGRTDVRNG
jgi:hypothetical protein